MEYKRHDYSWDIGWQDEPLPMSLKSDKDLATIIRSRAEELNDALREARKRGITTHTQVKNTSGLEEVHLVSITKLTYTNL